MKFLVPYQKCQNFAVLPLSFILTISALLACVSVTHAAPTEKLKLSMDEAYQLALAQSEALQESQELILAAEAQYQQALAALYPEIHILGTHRFRSSQNYGRLTGSTFSDDSSQGSNSSTGSRRSKPRDWSLTLRQPLFTGFRESLVADARESGLEAQRHLKVRQGELLYADVARVYAQTALYQRDDALLKRTEQVLSDRITELEKFRTLGKAREGEIEAALADKAAVSASRAQNQGLLGTSRELLNFLTGKTITNEQFELGVPSNLPSSQPPQVEEAPSRYDIKAKQAQLNAATLERKAAERGHLPTLFLEGNSYLYEEPDSNRDWEVLLKFDLPLFEGGATQAAIAEYRAKERASQVRLKLQEREAIKELKTAHVKLVSTRKELELIDVQRVAARKNLSAQRRDYELGLVTNLDVLAAIQQELEAERKYAGAQADLFIAHAELKVASGAVS